MPNFSTNRNKFNFTVVGKPIPQKRHRHLMNARGRTYDPSKKDKKVFLTECIKQLNDDWNQNNYAFINPLEHDGYIEVHIDFCMPIPKSTSKKQRNEMMDFVTYHTKRPDIDNLAKFVLDALGGFFWKDDSKVARLSLHKVYDFYPKTELTIHYLHGLQSATNYK